jgi:hypothetical protein
MKEYGGDHISGKCNNVLCIELCHRNNETETEHSVSL